MNEDKKLEVKIEDGVFSISIGTDILVHALKYGLEGSIEGELEITNKDEFLADLLNELESEQEDGSTPVHRMLDRAAYDAICNGAQGIEIADT